MRKISTILFALFCVLSMSAKTFYLKPNSNWTQGNAWFAAYYFDNSTSQNGWVKMTAVANDPGVYTAEIDDKYPTVIFCRMNPAKSALSWDSKWDQTVDLTVKGKAENCCAINDGQWNNANVTWSTYTPPTTIPDYYLTGTGNLVGGGGWSAKEIKMTYDDSTKTYSHTFVGLQAGEEYQMKVTTGTWDHSWGFANLKPAVENVKGSNDGNIVFEVQKLSDVTVTFDGTNISLEGKFGPAPTYMSVLLADLNVRRVLANNEGIYVLATDTNLVPTLVKADFAGQVQTIYNTDFCKAVGSKGVVMPLADIALTGDGVLLGINSEHVTTTKTEDQQPLIYKWNADGTGAIWIDTDDLVGGNENFAAGNFTNATVDMLAYNGTLASGKLVTRAYTQGSGNRSRMGVMQITDTVATKANTGYNRDLPVWTATEGVYLTAAPTATDNFIWSGATCAPTEWVTVLPGLQIISAAAATMADTYMGAKGFTFATVDEQTIMTIPSLTGVKVLNVTAGIATATEVQDLVATAAVTEAACMYATVVEIEGAKKVLLARDLTIELLDLPEIPEQTTNLETLINNANDVKKVIINGNLYIIRNNAMYNVQGQMVK